MTKIDLGAHFDGFVQEQVDRGRFRSASDVVRAGLSLLEEQEQGRARHRADLGRQIGAALDDPRPDLTADEVFERLERRHAARVAADRRVP